MPGVVRQGALVCCKQLISLKGVGVPGRAFCRHGSCKCKFYAKWYWSTGSRGVLNPCSRMKGGPLVPVLPSITLFLASA